MAINLLFSTFNLTAPGLVASDRFKEEAPVRENGIATTATANFDDPTQTFQAEGITTSHKIQILTGGGNIQRDVLITAIPSETRLVVAGGNFNQSEQPLDYKIYLPPTDTEILTDQSKRGLGILGYEELLQKADADTAAGLQVDAVAVLQNGLAHQTIIYDAT